jgi:molybdate/tungstate transport system ATP-binding protein
VIAIRDLSLRQGQFTLNDISLTIPTGKYGVLMGRTGSGKTTILEAVAGLRAVTSGQIFLHHQEVTHHSPGARGLGYVPQDGALFRTMKVYENLAFALLIRKEQPERIVARVKELAQWLGLTHLLGRRAVGLSGGEAQRVALGRALSFRPRTLLLDEPLSSLDEETREQLITLLVSLRERGDVTVLHVTHNRREAEALGDVVLRLEKGQIQVVG